MKIRLLTAFAAVAISGCVASDPKAITATPTPTLAYATLDCPGLKAEDARVAEELGYLSYRQDNRRTADAFGMIVVGITATGLGKADYAPQIAQLKGQRDAILEAKRAKACSDAQMPIDTSTAAKIRWRKRAQEDAAVEAAKPHVKATAVN